MSDDLKAFQANEEILRIYSWQPKCISLGYSQDIKEEINIEQAKRMSWDIVQRPTGGGIVFHNEQEITYSLIAQKERLPAGFLPSFLKISEAVVLALSYLGIKSKIVGCRSEVISGLCFASTEGYEIEAGGGKTVGAAQKRGKRAILQQGSIYVKSIEKETYKILKRPYQEPDAVSIEEILGRVPTFDELSQALVSGFREGLGFEI